jgi:hypothetical protein
MKEQGAGGTVQVGDRGRSLKRLIRDLNSKYIRIVVGLVLFAG